jgi:hypothetical protein
MGPIALRTIIESRPKEPSACLDVGSVEMTVLSIGGVPSNMFSTLLITEAIKLLAIGRSSQVHPVIAMEVMTSADCNSSTTPNNEHLLKQISITSLIFLASGRNATPSKSSVCLIHNILSEKADNNESFHYFAKR